MSCRKSALMSGALQWALTPEPRRQVRREILSDLKERRGYWLGWLPLVSAITGLVGVLSGLVAWLLKEG